MQPGENLLTVSEFAKRSGRSRKRIYELVKSGKLSEYCQTENSKIMIAESALSLFAETVTVTTENCHGDKNSVTVTKSEVFADTEIPQSESVTVTEKSCHGDKETVTVTEQNCHGDKALQDHITDLQSEIQTLRAQLETKDSQLSQQSEQLAAVTAALQIAQEQNRELTNALTAAQALNAGTMQMLMDKAAPDPVTASQDDEQRQPPGSSQDEKPPLRSAPPEDDAAAALSGSEAEARKPGLFARLFRKRK